QQHLLRVYLPLQVVEQRPVALFPQPDRSSDDRQDGFEIATCSEVDEVDAALEVAEEISGRLQRQPGLAGTAGAQQREQARFAEPILDLYELVGAHDDTVEGRREVAATRAERPFAWRLEALTEQHYQVVF